jgi:hypothetical protein
VADSAWAISDGQGGGSRNSVGLITQGDSGWGWAISRVSADDLGGIYSTGRDGSSLGGVPRRWDHIGRWWWWRGSNSSVPVGWDHVGSWGWRGSRDGSRLACSSGCLRLWLTVCARAIGDSQGSRLSDAVGVGANGEGGWGWANSGENIGSIGNPCSVLSSSGGGCRLGSMRISLRSDRSSSRSSAATARNRSCWRGTARKS